VIRAFLPLAGGLELSASSVTCGSRIRQNSGYALWVLRGDSRVLPAWQVGRTLREFGCVP